MPAPANDEVFEYQPDAGMRDQDSKDVSMYLRDREQKTKFGEEVDIVTENNISVGVERFANTKYVKVMAPKSVPIPFMPSTNISS